MARKDGGPAFPSAVLFDQDIQQTAGMTKREWFAGLAMQGMLPGESWADTDPNYVAKCAVNLADALLAELAKDD